MRPNYNEEKYNLLLDYVDPHLDVDTHSLDTAISQAVEEARDEGRPVHKTDLMEKFGYDV